MIVLMISLGFVERSRSFYQSHNFSTFETIGCRLFLDECFGLLQLLVFCGEYRRTILRAHVRTLPIELRWIVEFEEPLQQLMVSDAFGIEGDANGFRVAGATGAHLLIAR